MEKIGAHEQNTKNKKLQNELTLQRPDVFKNTTIIGLKTLQKLIKKNRKKKESRCKMFISKIRNFSTVQDV